MTLSEIAFNAAIAQAAYTFFSPDRQDVQSLVQNSGEFAQTAANRFVGLTGGDAGPFVGGVLRVAHEPDELNGFSATVFRRNDTGQAILAIRGTNGPVDFAQDAKLVILGVATDQAISLFRYYRCLTTPAGQQVTYSADEINLLHRLNTPVPLLSPFGALTNAALDIQLAGDRGLGVLQPNESLVVTGHSLGGHLATIFGRFFPSVTQDVFAFNSPGISSWGNSLLDAAGLAANDPAHVTNVVSSNGLDLTSAYGSRPGETIRVFNEISDNPVQNHSIARLSESLALFDLFGQLSPGLAERPAEITSILEAASARPEESLEAALDMLGLVTGASDATTPIAVTTADGTAREAYFDKLYSLRDQFAGGQDWRIVSLEGLSSSQITGLSSLPAVRYALSELMPFAAIGGTFDDSLATLSPQWIAARADFLSALLEERTKDLLLVDSGSRENVVFVDVDRDERLSLLNQMTAAEALSQGSDASIKAYLDAVSYNRMTIFGSDDADRPDSLAGSGGIDRIFGAAGDDTLDARAGDDLIEDGAGADLLLGGAGNDAYYLIDDEAVDRIRDADGKGSVHVAGSVLTGGFEHSDGIYLSADSQHTYAFSGDLESRGTLTVDASLVIEDFLNGELGILLGRIPDESAGATTFTYAGERIVLLEDPLDPWENKLPTGPGYEGMFDYFPAGRPGDTKFDVGAGNDYVADIHGGNDVLLLGDGEDYGVGGDGNDWIEGGDDYDFLVGSAGNDLIFAGAEGDDIEAALPAWTPAVQVFLMDILSGGEGNDVLVGSRLPDYLEGGAGSDLIFGGAARDLIAGDGHFRDSGNETNFSTDFLRGVSNIPPQGIFSFLSPIAAFLDLPEAGNDTIYSGSGDDLVDGGGGNDLIFGGTGNDSIAGGRGDDELHADGGYDTLAGGDGNDILYGGIGVATSYLYGDAGDDTLVAAGLGNNLQGGPGADLYMGAGTFAASVGDGDTFRFKFGQGQSAFVTADGASAASITIEFSPEVLPEQVFFLGSSGPSWGLASSSDPGTINFEGAFSQWTDVTAKFADGTTWVHEDFAAHIFTPQAPTPLPSIGGSGEGGEGGGPPPDPNDSQYYISGGGRETISDHAGNDRVIFFTASSQDVSVFSSGSDMLLRYAGGEVRLAGQVDAANGIESVIFYGDGVIWDRATLAAHASVLPENQPAPLGVQVAATGHAFDYVLGADAFANDYVIGSSHLEATNLQGGALPSWLSFDAEHGRFSGTPAAADAGVTAVLVALRDDSGIAAVAPLVISVEAASQSTCGAGISVGGSSSGGGGPSAFTPVGPSAISASGPAPVAAHVSANSREFATTIPLQMPVSAAEGLPQQRTDDDQVQRSIERLLSTSASSAPASPLEQYLESIRSFQARKSAQADASAATLPSDVEIAQQNASVHAWLDADQREQSMPGNGAEWDLGGSAVNYFGAGAESTGSWRRRPMNSRGRG